MSRSRLKLDRTAGGVAALLAFGLLLLPLWFASFPSPPGKLTLDVMFPRGVEGRGEPIITTGRARDGDFLAVRYISGETAVLFYDVWGVGGPVSQSFALRPGQRRRIEIEMPTLPPVAHVVSKEQRPLRVTLDGDPLLDAPVYFHPRKPAEIFFATNPIGGTLVDEHFRGELALPGGKRLKGGPSSLFGWGARVVWIVRTESLALLLHLACALIIGASVSWLYPQRTRLRLPRLKQDRPRTVFPPRRLVPPHAWFGATGIVCTIAFTAVLTQGTFRMIAPDEFGKFYDIQARSFLEGRLSLPDSARNSESFIFEGRNYMYFGPTPAVLRLPLTLLDIAFGQLSRCFMVLYFGALLVAVYLLQIHVSRVATGSMSWPSRIAVVLFVGTVGMGSTLFYLASRTYVYHEAIFCGATFAIWSGYFTLRYLSEPQRRWWIGALACGLCSVHARPPTGLFALALVGFAAVVVGIRSLLMERENSGRFAASAVAALRQPVFIGAMAVLCVFSFNGLSYLKFKSFEGAPLKYHVGYQDGRFAVIAGKNFHLSNFRFNFDAYMWRPDFSIERKFPFIFIRNPQDLSYPGVRIDLFEPTLAMPYTMPALVFLSLLAGTFTLVAWPEARSALGVIGAAGSVMALALFTAVAVSHRYTGDFCPALILSGAFGLQSLELLPHGWRRALMIFTAMLVVLGIAITLAITLHYQGAVVWGVPDEVKARYEGLRTTVDRMLGLIR